MLLNCILDHELLGEFLQPHVHRGADVRCDVGKRSSPARLPHSMNGGSDRAAFIIARSPEASPASACSGGAGACVVPPPFVVPNKHNHPA